MTDQQRIDMFKKALETIRKPSGVYSRDPAIYNQNVVEYCIETADKALKDYASSFAHFDKDGIPHSNE